MWVLEMWFSVEDGDSAGLTAGHDTLGLFQP